MSFSFNVRAADKAEAKAKVSEQLDSIEAQQPIHANDRKAIQKAVESYIDLLQDNDDRDVNVTVSGSVSGAYVDGVWSTEHLTAASLSINAAQVDREVVEQEAAEAE